MIPALYDTELNFLKENSTLFEQIYLEIPDALYEELKIEKYYQDEVTLEVRKSDEQIEQELRNLLN